MLEKIKLFDFKYLGMGLLLTWTVCRGLGHTIALSSLANSPKISLDLLVLVISSVLTLAYCVKFSGRFDGLMGRKPVIGTACVAMSVGSALPLLSIIAPSLFFVFEILGAMLSGVGSAVIFLGWNELYSTLPYSETTVLFSASYLLSITIYFVFLALPPMLSACLDCLIPLLCGFLLLRCVMQGVTSSASGGLPVQWSFPAMPVFLAATFTFCFFYLINLNGDRFAFDWLGGAFVALPAIVLALFCKRIGIEWLYRVAFPLMLAGGLLWIVGGANHEVLTSILINASHTGFKIFIMVALCNICFRYGISSIWLLGTVRAVTLIAELAGAYFGRYVILFAGTDSPITEYLTAAIILCLGIVSMFTLGKSDLFSSTWTMHPKASTGLEALAPSSSAFGHHEILVVRCSKAARRYGLTHREEEVLACLAQSKTTAQIETMLSVSHNTAKTHIRHIYEKLGVHSRNEVMDVLERSTPS